MYFIGFDFDCEDEPPTTYIYDGDGTAVAEVFHEPTLIAEAWTWEPEGWMPSAFALELVNALNNKGTK